jgi:hypothetical protein
MDSFLEILTGAAGDLLASLISFAVSILSSLFLLEKWDKFFSKKALSPIKKSLFKKKWA